MNKISLIIIILLINAIFCIENGLFLYSPIISLPSDDEVFVTELIDLDGNLIKQWTHDCSVSSTPYLLPEGILLRPCKVDPPPFEAGGAGGKIQFINWSGEIIWENQFANDEFAQHHDVEVLPNGNLLILMWERKSQEEAIQAGKVLHTGDFWSEKIIEIELLEDNDFNIIWEWSLWNHLVQDIDSNYNNFGNIAENSGKLDINYALISNEGPLPPQFTNPDFIHLNSLDYSEELDLILFSSRKTCEIYVIDHSTSISESNDSIGGNYGKGGDFLYRWGNQSIYDHGESEDKKLFAPHSATWTSNSSIMVFNNGVNRPGNNYSSIIEIEFQIEDNLFNYSSDFGYYPEFPTIEYNLNENYFTQTQGGAFKIANENIIATISNAQKILEISSDGNILWEYDYPGNGNLSRSQKYQLDYFDFELIYDLNNDLLLNILDVVILVNMVLDNTYILNADLNNDALINVLDIVQLVNLILT